jgi:hypothetical protein
VFARLDGFPCACACANVFDCVTEPSLVADCCRTAWSPQVMHSPNNNKQNHHFPIFPDQIGISEWQRRPALHFTSRLNQVRSVPYHFLRVSGARPVVNQRHQIIHWGLISNVSTPPGNTGLALLLAVLCIFPTAGTSHLPPVSGLRLLLGSTTAHLAPLRTTGTFL